ncbi:MAG: YqeG family HAD IIIA-type phosphatase [Candidatus Margulisiibacteriota bacterium]
MKEYWDNFKELFRPKEIVKNIYEIDFNHLKKKNIRALIVDIDDTLIPRGVNDIYPEVFEWIATRKEEGFKICLTSNSHHPLRVKYFGDTLGLPARPLSFKPLPFAFWKSLEILKSKPEETAMIGDQLFMDILGANFLKIYSIFIQHGREESYWLRKAMRWAEKWVMRHWLSMPKL